MGLKNILYIDIIVLTLTPQSLHRGISTLFPLADHVHSSIADDLPHFYFILNFYCLLILAHPFISHTNIYCQCPPAYWSGCRGPWALRIFFILLCWILPFVLPKRGRVLLSIDFVGSYTFFLILLAHLF